MTTIKDIAAQAQVSATTVSHALNPQKRHLVAPETVQKVKAIAQRLKKRLRIPIGALSNKEFMKPHAKNEFKLPKN